MSWVEIVSDRYTLCHGGVLLTEQVRRVFTKTHETAAVHLSHDPVTSSGINLRALHDIVGLILDVCCRIFLVASNRCQQTRLVVELPLHVFEGSIKLLKLCM
jgi:hypothetical protein